MGAGPVACGPGPASAVAGAEQIGAAGSSARPGLGAFDVTSLEGGDEAAALELAEQRVAACGFGHGAVVEYEGSFTSAAFDFGEETEIFQDGDHAGEGASRPRRSKVGR